MESLAPTLRAVAADWLKKTEPAAVPLVLWPTVCGEAVAARTKARDFTDGQLTIAVPDRQWVEQLREFIPQYLASINAVAPIKVRVILFESQSSQSSK